jgi:3-methyl-2-oxobutanoate hydroxymethyltransferase
VGINLWGQPNPLEVTMDQMVTVAQAVRRGTKRALVSVDFPYGPLQEGVDAAVRAAIRLVKEAGVDMIKLDGAADFPEAVTALTRAGIPVWAQFGITPQTALQYGMEYSAMSKAGAQVPVGMMERLVEEARMLERAGAALLDFTNSGPVVGPAATAVCAWRTQRLVTLPRTWTTTSKPTPMWLRSPTTRSPPSAPTSRPLARSKGHRP